MKSISSSHKSKIHKSVPHSKISEKHSTNSSLMLSSVSPMACQLFDSGNIVLLDLQNLKIISRFFLFQGARSLTLRKNCNKPDLLGQNLECTSAQRNPSLLILSNKLSQNVFWKRSKDISRFLTLI